LNLNNILKITFLVFAIAISSSVYSAIELWAPRQVNPAFVRPGETFTAEVRASSSLSSSGWNASVENSLRTWNCKIVSAEYSMINRGTENGWRLTIQVPADIPPELFRLNISHPAGGSTGWSNAVSVVQDFETDFYILQLTDEQIDRNIATTQDGYRSAQLIGWAVPVINLINPRFVLNTGDEVDNAWENTDAKFQWYVSARAGYEVPCITVKGNNDDRVDAKWESYFGQRSFSLRLGSFYILAHDFNDSALRTWALSDYNTNWSDPSIKYRLIAQHAWIDSGYPGVFIPDSDKPCDLMLMGHLHANAIKQSSPYYALCTQSAEHYANGGFFNFVKIGSDWFCTSPLSTHSSGSNNIQLVGDWGTPRVSVQYVLPNDGTQIINTATVTNKIGIDFYDGRLKFLMAKGNYKVTGGTKIAEYDYSGGAKTAVLVKVYIPRSTGTEDGTVTATVTKVMLKITTPPGTTIAGLVSDSMVVEVQDFSGTRDFSFNDTVRLESSSRTGRFSVNGTDWSVSNTTIIMLSSGTGSFYYKDKRGGNPVITVAGINTCFSDTRAQAVIQPVIAVQKSLTNLRSGCSGTVSVAVFPGDTIEYILTITNSGTETATGVVVTDTYVFDTNIFMPLVFISIDTSSSETLAYTTTPNPLESDWIAGTPDEGRKDIKGLRWKIDSIVAGKQKQVKFRVSPACN